MKLSPQTTEIVRKMAPGVIVRDGMLGHDRRSLPEILDADAGTVARLGVTHEALGRRMEQVSEAARRALGEAVPFEGRYEAQSLEVQGRMRCPFGDPGALRKAVTTVRRLADGKSLRWSDLGAHMVRAHGFYQGAGSAWRLEPEELAGFLGLAGSGG